MNKRLAFLFLVCFAILVSVPVRAEIFLSQPREIYNIGDSLSVNLSIKQSYDVFGGLLQLSVVCPSTSVAFYADGNVNLEANKLQEFNAVWSKISDVSGLCYIQAQADFESGAVRSNEFVITDRIDVSLEQNKMHFQPTETLLIEGRATKANSVPAEGFAEIDIKGLVESQHVDVKEGRFNVAINIPSNTPAKEYTARVSVFEKDYSGKTTNKGTAEIKIYVLSVPAKLDLSINEEKFLPNQTAIIKASLYDQSSQLVKGNISLKIKDSKGNLAIDTITESGKDLKYLFELNSVAGDWVIEASAFNLETRRMIFMQEYKAISVSLKNNKLIIKNIGNVLYNEAIRVKFIDSDGEEKIISENVNLDVAEELAIRLLAPEGVYDIEAAGHKFSGIPLTGKATASIELERSNGVLARVPLTSALIFILLFVFIVLFLHRAGQQVRQPPKSRDSSFIEVSAVKGPSKPIVPDTSSEKRKTGTETQTFYPVKTAETALVLQGQKQNASVLYFRVKNIAELQDKISALAFESLKNFAIKTVNDSVDDNKGALQRISDTEFIAIFAPILRQFRHESSATRTAVEIDNRLKEQNRKLKGKIEYGIGVSSGELALSISQKKILKYTSIGKTIAIARKLSEKSANSVILSKDVYLRVMNEVKAKSLGDVKVGDEEIECYVVEGVLGREAYSSYVHDILRRMKK